MGDLRQAAQQALEFLEGGSFVYPTQLATALREALAQPEQEPVVYDKTEINSFVIDLYDLKMKEGKHGHYEALFHCVHQAIARVNAPASQPEQEPVTCRFCHDARGCWTWQCYKCGEIDDVQKPTPPAPQRPWQGLTDDEANLLWENTDDRDSWELIKRVEAKLKELNK